MILSAIIVLAVAGAVGLFLRWALTEGSEPPAPAWTLRGTVSSIGVPQTLARRVVVAPSRSGLRLAEEANPDRWGPQIPWHSVRVEVSGLCLLVTGPFGELICPVTAPDSIGGVLARIEAMREPGRQPGDG